MKLLPLLLCWVLNQMVGKLFKVLQAWNYDELRISCKQQSQPRYSQRYVQVVHTEARKASTAVCQTRLILCYPLKALPTGSLSYSAGDLSETSALL